LELRLCDGLGGKAFFYLSGSLDMVEAAVWAAERITPPALFASREVIARPHEDLIATLLPRT
jgi:microcompartment protein CcmL/EutN